ncbi:unnamed protein product, partial [Owenia fusiformis]
LYFVYTTLEIYFEYNTHTKASILRINEVDYFPDITLCNIRNQANSRFFTNDGNLTIYAQRIRKYMTSALYKLHDLFDADITSDLTTIGMYDLEKLFITTINKVGANQKNLTRSEQKVLESLTDFRSYFTMFNSSEREDMGHQKHDIIKQCRVLKWLETDEEDCNVESIILYQDMKYINCYTVQLQKQVTNKTRGISTVLYMTPHNFAVLESIPEKIPQDSGIVVFIHQHNTMPFGAPSFTAAPGFKTMVNIDVTNTITLPAPFTNCVQERKLNFTKYNGDEFVYDKEPCVAQCVQEQALKQCKCLNADFPPLPNASYCTDLTLDSKLYEANIACMHTALPTAETKPCLKQCPSKCNQYIYNYKLSQSTWPQEMSHLGIYKTYIRGTQYESEFTDYEALLKENAPNLTNKERYDKLRTLSTIKDTFVKLEIGLTDKDVIQFKDTPQLTKFDIWNTVASTFIFWIGFTFFSIMEIIECAFHVAIGYMFHGGRTREHPDKRKQVEMGDKGDNNTKY